MTTAASFAASPLGSVAAVGSQIAAQENVDEAGAILILNTIRCAMSATFVNQHLTMDANVVIHGDCIEVMSGLQAASVDMVLADVPYGQTQNAWDRPIPFKPMWRELRRVTKENAAIVLFAAQPFASRLVCSNLEDFRYDLQWKKNKPTGFLNAKKQPLRIHEHILVFYRKPPFYAPQMTTGHKPGNYARRIKGSSNYGAQTPTEYGGSTERYPTSVLEVPIVNNDDPDKHHPTQKPVDLLALLIRSYSREGDTVLDFTAGAGTTAIAALRERRRFICIEAEQQYVAISNKRIEAEAAAAPLLHC